MGAGDRLSLTGKLAGVRRRFAMAAEPATDHAERRTMAVTTWVVVADGSRARIFETPGLKLDLREIEDLVNVVPSGLADAVPVDVVDAVCERAEPAASRNALIPHTMIATLLIPTNLSRARPFGNGRPRSTAGCVSRGTAE